MVLEQLDIHMSKRGWGGPRQKPYTMNRTNLKWVTNLNVKLKSITFLEESAREDLCDFELKKFS